VAVVRAFIPSGRISNQVVEHELDMNRIGARSPARVSKLRGWIRWLKPGSHLVVAPMRSVDRELEDVWPSGNRQT
jgi:hypothetical protein